MAIFSRSKKVSKTAGPDQTPAVAAPVGTPLPTPSRPAPHPPIDPTKPAVTVTAEEVRARIAASRRRQSGVNCRSAFPTYTHSRDSRAISEYSLPGYGWQTHRVQGHTSIEAILQEMPIHEAELLPPPLVVRGREPFRTAIQNSITRRHSEEDFHAYSNPRPVPLPPIKTKAPPPSPRSRSRRLTKTKPSSPLSTVFTLPDDDYFSSSSRDSTRNSSSTTNSVTSSATSASSILNERVETKQSPAKVPNFSKPTLATRREKEVPELDISLPYSAKVEGKEEEVKTAKSLIPTWRYEDFKTDNALPEPVTSIPPTHTRNKSWNQGHVRRSSFGGTIKFKKRNLSVSAF